MSGFFAAYAHASAITPVKPFPIVLNHFDFLFLLTYTVYMLYTISMTAREIMKILKDNGWTLERISGSHHVFEKEGCRPVTVPFHGNKDIGNFGKRILKEEGIK